MRFAALALILVGCSSEGDPAFSISRPSAVPDSGPPRICGVVPESKCDHEGEITRCLCGSFEDQIGRFVCCRSGIAVVLECQQAQFARDCDGKLVGAGDAGSD